MNSLPPSNVRSGRAGGSRLRIAPALRPVFALLLGLVVAACGGGGGAVTPGPGVLPPEAPGSLTVELTPNGDALLRWTAPAPAGGRAPVTGYKVYLESAGGRFQALGTTRSRSYRHEGLQAGRRYVYHVRASSRAGDSPPSESAFVDVPPQPFPPEAPGSLTVELTPNGDALLRWTAPAPAEGRASVTGYKVYLESAGGRFQALGTTRSRSYRHEGLQAGRRYVYHVRASSRAGDSPPSESAFVDVPPQPFPPEAPGSLTVELTPNGDALLRWTAPAPAEGRAPVREYEVYVEYTDGRFGTLGTTRSRSYRHADLRAGQRYVYHVRARSAAGVSPPSDSASVDVPPGLVPPDPPPVLTAELTPERHALLRWTAPAPAEGHAPVTGYEVYLEPAGDGTPRRLGQTVGALSFRHTGERNTGLPFGTRYVYHIRALSAGGKKSRPSESAYVDVPPGLVPPDPPRSLTAELTPQRHALLRWTAPAPAEGRAPVTNYEVYLEPVDGGTPRRLGQTVGALSFRHTGERNTGLPFGTRYVYHVRALSADGKKSQPSESAYVDVLRPSQPPEAPGSFTAELTQNGEVLLRWTAPVPAEDRAPVTGYRVWFQAASGGNPRSIEVAGNAVFLLHAGISPGTYVYYVVARSEVADSAPSTSAFVEVPGVPGLPLAAPRLSVRADDDEGAVDPDGRRVRIAWIQPLSEPPSARVMDFRLQSCDVAPDHSSDHCGGGWRSRSVSGEDLEALPEMAPETPPVIPRATRVVNDLIDCDPMGSDTNRKARMYRIQAQASDPANSSPWSATVGPVCPSTNYSPPRRVDAIFVEPTPGMAFNFCWEVPNDNGSPMTGYEIQMSPDEELPGTEDGWWVLDAHVNPTDDATQECRLYSGLVEDDERWFRIRAYNLAGHGNWSAPYRYAHTSDTPIPQAGNSTGSPDGVLAVADARAFEREGARLRFEVTLEGPLPGPVTVDYATEDGTAKAGEDYIGTRGTLRFAPGEVTKRVEVTVIDDAKDEGEESLTLHLHNAAGARIEDAEATGTIENDDRMAAAWLARFGRTIAAQTVDAMGDRFASAPGSHVSVGGVPLRLSEIGDAPPSGESGQGRWPGDAEEARTLAGRELLHGSAFHLSTPGDGDPIVSAWGRFATGGFDASTEGMRLDGDVTTGFLGMDVDGGRWLAGAMLSHSEGDGVFRFGSGDLPHDEHREETRSTLTGVYPYARLALDERFSLWGLAGGGRGTLTLTGSDRSPRQTDIDMTMGALGARAALLSPGQAEDLALDLRSDAFWVRTRSDALHSTRAGNLASTRSDASRLRLFLEGTRSVTLDTGGTLTPSLEVGVRHDGGDVETGMGLEIGTGLRYSGAGITVEGTLRTLVAHEETGYEEWEASGLLRIEPRTSGRGLSLTLAPVFSSAASAGERPWWGDATRLPLAGSAGGAGSGKRVGGELGYGLEFAGMRGLVTPYTGVSIRPGGAHEWRLGARWGVTPYFTMSLEGTRHRAAGEEESDQALMLRGAVYR